MDTSSICRPTSQEVANEFIGRALRRGAAITHMQVQKLVYFAHGFSLALSGEPLISDQFEAWRFGPVARPLYDALKRYGSGPIPREIRTGDDTLAFDDDDSDLPLRANLPARDQNIIDTIFRTFGDREAFRLSAITHAPGGAWDKTYRSGAGRNRPIPDALIKAEFEDMIPAE